jgi:cation-transporting ATPase E
VTKGPLLATGPAAALVGLSSAEVADRVAAGQVNRAPEATGRRWHQILARNTFTWLNFLFALLGAASLSTGAGPDATFLVIALINTAVGTVQEIRARRTLDRLAVINAPGVRLLRDGAVTDVGVEDVVLGDLLQLRAGDQVVADATVAAGTGEVDESAATGESEPVPAGPGDHLLSGGWLVGGEVWAQVTAVGAESYAGRLAVEARRLSLTGSELMAGINTILRWLSLAMVVIAPALLVRQLQVQAWRPAVRATVAGLVGMIPEGLVLLTTLAFLTSAVRLGAHRVLVQELPAVEVLARVDALCTDKTGTLTEGGVEWSGLLLADQAGDAPAALAAVAAAPGANATLDAIRVGAGPPVPGWEVRTAVPFTSARKWSGATFAGRGTWILGAAEVVTGADPSGLVPRAAELAAGGARVLVLARSPRPLTGPGLPDALVVRAVVHLRERLRPDAPAALAYFERQGVVVRVVSGDSASTAGAVATHVGLPGADRTVDARAWPASQEQVDDLVEHGRVFGRVTPEQKRLMVDALRRRGHVIAMTGDGVNDTLALKDADLGVAMGSGSTVARNVAQLVLLDDRFSVLPSVVSEGRRVLHNVEAVAVLFLVKNVYSIVISVVTAVVGWPYPFLPRHLTLISGLAIGIPAFFLAFAPSEQRFTPGFVRRVVRFAALAGSVVAAAVLVTYAVARAQDTPPDEARTAAVIVVIVASLWVLLLVAMPPRAWKLGLVAVIAAAFAAAFMTPGINAFFSIDHRPPLPVVGQSVLLGGAACAVLTAGAALAAIRRHRHPAPG